MDWGEVGEAAAQLGVNLVALVLGGLARLAVQRRVSERRLMRHSRGETSERSVQHSNRTGGTTAPPSTRSPARALEDAEAPRKLPRYSLS